MLGNGIGATAALTYAATHPTRVLGLALSGPLGFGAGGRFGRMAGRALGRPALLRRLEPLLTSLALGPNTPLTNAIALRRRAQRARDDYPASVAAFAALWRSLEGCGDELVATAKKITAPAIVLRGAMDALVTEADAQRATDALGAHGAVTVTLPDAGHLPFLQQPGPFLRAVAGVLNTAEANMAEQNCRDIHHLKHISIIGKRSGAHQHGFAAMMGFRAFGFAGHQRLLFWGTTRTAESSPTDSRV